MPHFDRIAAGDFLKSSILVTIYKSGKLPAVRYFKNYCNIVDLKHSGINGLLNKRKGIGMVSVCRNRLFFLLVEVQQG